MSSSTDVFFSERNEAMLQRVLYNDVCRRTGNDLNEKQATRLIKTVKHYMGEIHRVNGSKPVSDLNKEVLRIVLPDYIMYLDRKERSDGRSITSLSEEVSSTEVIEMTETIPEGRRLQMDVGTAFSKLQSSRQETKSRPPIQDFRLSLQDEPPVSMDNFERMKQEREEEAARVSAQQQAQAEGQRQRQGLAASDPRMQGLAASDPRMQGQAEGQRGQQRFADATDVFSRGSKRAMEEAEAAFAERERKALESRAAASQVFTTTAPPDMRALFMGDRQTLDRTRVPSANAAASNPTVAQDSRTTSQQMMIVREPETMAYKETELNLFIYSGDRDWVSNSLETRYNFTVNFDPSNMPVGLRLSPTSTAKFRNIVRVEFVKAIMPGEGLDMIVSKSGVSGAGAYDSSVNVNILSFPYIQVRIPELDTNNYGTNQGLNSAFGVLQYDGNWISDTTVATQRGYLAMIPKFMKCQKTYTPTPLATIQKLSFQFQRPDGTLLSTAADTLDIGQIFPTLAVNTTTFSLGGQVTNTNYRTDITVDVGASAYYWLKTTKYFNHWTVSRGDKIVVKNLAWATQPNGNAIPQTGDFLSYIQQDSGLLVVDTGVITGTSISTYIFQSGDVNSYNAQGYANAILVRGKFVDPTIAGGLLPATLGGIADTYAPGNLSHFLTNTALVTGRLLNQSHQVQIAMRVITRELDSTGILRPDNL
jgi:hypothetical protein